MTVSLDTSSSPTLHDPDSLLDYFTELADPRREQGRIHRVDEIIFLSICAVTCGADSWEGERNGDAAGELSRCSWHGEEDTNLCLGWPDRSRDVSPYFLGHPDRIGPKGVVTILVEIA